MTMNAGPGDDGGGTFGRPRQEPQSKAHRGLKSLPWWVAPVTVVTLLLVLGLSVGFGATR